MLISKSWQAPCIRHPTWWRPPISQVCLADWRTSRAGERTPFVLFKSVIRGTPVRVSDCVFLRRLSLCEKALAEYLDTKRLAFPRFYFISSADLLDILSNGTNPHQVAEGKALFTS